VQAIKPPTLLEICAPLFMSCPAVSNVQYRLTEEHGITRLKFTHRAMGQISHDIHIERGRAQIETGWDNLMPGFDLPLRSTATNDEQKKKTVMTGHIVVSRQGCSDALGCEGLIGGEIFV
jgi:hypothetical protein